MGSPPQCCDARKRGKRAEFFFLLQSAVSLPRTGGCLLVDDEYEWDVDGDSLAQAGGGGVDRTWPSFLAASVIGCGGFRIGWQLVRFPGKVRAPGTCPRALQHPARNNTLAPFSVEIRTAGLC